MPMMKPTGGGGPRSNTWLIVAMIAVAVAVIAFGLLATQGRSQTCKPEDVFATIDATGAKLREINSDWQPRLQAKLKQLAQKRGWADGEAETKGRAVIEDAETRRLDERAAGLLADLDRLGDDTRTTLAPCERLEQVRTKSGQLVEVTAQRAAHVTARLDIALNPPPPAAPQLAAASPAVAPSAAVAAPPQRQVVAPATPAPATRVPPQSAPAQPQQAWPATVREVEPAAGVIADLPPPVDPGALGYSPDEIRAAGRGFFGSISAGLAGVIDYAFQRYGRPSGYVLGDEGGGAFVAGLRYGEGRLVTKQGGERKVYWQGPSAGFDFGVSGSQVMFLVYNVQDHEQMFQRFTGVDGSAYLVGGVGITFLKRGRVVLAPIRTGLGMRLGANIGYLKFTPRPSLNPF